jgi:hypothetical protein
MKKKYIPTARRRQLLSRDGKRKNGSGQGRSNHEEIKPEHEEKKK